MRIRLGFTCVQIGDPAHRKSRQIGDCYAFSPRHRNWKSADRCRLIDDMMRSFANVDADENLDALLVFDEG